MFCRSFFFELFQSYVGSISVDYLYALINIITQIVREKTSFKGRKRDVNIFVKVRGNAQTFALRKSMNYVIETFLSVSFSDTSKQLLCFVDQGQKEQRTSSSSQTIAMSESWSWLTILFSEKNLSKTNHNSFTTPGETIGSDCVVFALETSHEELPLGCEILHHRRDSQLQFWQNHCLRFKRYCAYLNKSANYVSYLIAYGLFRRSIYSAFDWTDCTSVFRRDSLTQEQFDSTCVFY